MVFNVRAINQDDHVKNISFLMNRKGIWSLSPAYDITFAYNSNNQWLKTHQMSVNRQVSNISKNDIITCGINMDLKASKCQKIFQEVYNAIKEFDNISRSLGIRDKTINMIQKKLDIQL